jgi:signal transduction histidine kinase
MMLRLTFAVRLGLIILLGIGMAWLFAIAAFYRSRASDGGVTPPAPSQILALVELLERTPAPDRPLVLQAVSSKGFVVRIDADAQRARASRRPPAGKFDLDPYLAALDGRTVSVDYVDRQSRRAALRSLFPVPELHIGLRSGGILAIDLQDDLLLGPMGFPIGFGGGIVGTLIAFIALVVMHREARPLARLAEAVDGVDLSVSPRLLPEARRSAPEIRALISAFNRLQGRLSELLRARMVMLGGISHDVRTFATRLRFRVEQIGDAAERDRAIADIDDMIHLLDDALLASRAGAGELAEEMLEIDDVVRAEVADRQAGGVLIDYRPGRWIRAPVVLGDRLALKRIVANLADNAVKYGGAAHVSTRIDGDSVVIIIDDEGPGIPPDKRQAMLEPFSRLETSRNRGTGGAGLGLAVVRALTEAHGGTLTIEDAPTRGARISVALPLFVAG